MSAEPSVALRADNVDFAYPGADGGTLRDIIVRICRGERVGIIGPNGAGKTTFFLLACGVLRPSSGEIRLYQEPSTSRGFDPRTALVFQRPDDQLFCPTVRDDVAFGPQNMGLDSNEVDARVREALHAIGAASLAHRPVHHLSEGQKKMVAIATALAMRPDLILYDEPSAALDIATRRRLIALMPASAETILVASHDLELLLEVCTRVILMDRGRIIAQGEPVAIMGDAELMQAHGQEKPHSLVPHDSRHKHDT